MTSNLTITSRSRRSRKNLVREQVVLLSKGQPIGCDKGVVLGVQSQDTVKGISAKTNFGVIVLLVVLLSVAIAVCTKCSCFDLPPNVPTAQMNRGRVMQAIRQLSSESESERIQGLSDLRDAGPASAAAAPYVGQILKGSQSQKERIRALHALLDMGPAAAPAVPGVIAVAKQPLGETEYALALDIFKNAAPRSRAAVDFLVGTVVYHSEHVPGDPTSKFDMNASMALAQTGRSGAIALEEVLLDCKDAMARRRAITVLCNMDANCAAPALVKALGDKDDYLRLVAIDMLRRVTDAEAIYLVLGLIENENEAVRADAASVFRKPCNIPTIEVLANALAEEPNAEVRLACVQALTLAAPPNAFEALLPALRDPDGRVREAAASALGDTNDRRAFEPLVRALEDSSHKVRSAAAKALRQMSGEDLGDDAKVWRNWLKANTD